MRGPPLAIPVAALALSGCAAFGYPERRPPATPPAGTADAPAPRPGPDEYEVLGRRYRVLPTAEGYVETGLASWYGEEFAGRPTSSGEPFDPRGLTAAHRTLPLSTWIEVTNLENGLKVVARVNDRGPFADPDRRIVDLSEEAARRIDMIGAGVVRVEVRALSPGEMPPPD